MGDPLEAILRRNAAIAMHTLLTELGYAHERNAKAFRAREGANRLITEERLKVLIDHIIHTH